MFKTMFKNKKLKRMLTQIELIENLATDEEEEQKNNSDNCNKCGKNNRTLTELNSMYNNLNYNIQKMKNKIFIMNKSIHKNNKKIIHVQEEVDDAHNQYYNAKKINKKNY